MRAAFLDRNFVLVCITVEPIWPISPILPIAKLTTYLFSITAFVVPFQSRFTPKYAAPARKML
jgi:hypothetical protein